MNLRDKLRGQGAELEAEVPAAEPAPKAEAAKGKGRQGAPALLPKIDVNRRFLLLAGAAAAMASLMAVMFLNDSAKGIKQAGKPIAVLVATKDIPAGARLTEDMVETKEIPQAFLVDQQFFADFKDLEDRIAIAPMVKGEPVYDVRTSEPNPKYGIAYLLKSGQRAKSISVDSASGLAGLIKPGNEVDLVATIPDPSDNSRRISVPVLQKAQVIAVGDRLLGAPPPAEGESAVDSGISSNGTITMAIPTQKVAMITLLEDLGSLKAILRATGDDTVNEVPYSDAQIMALVSGRVPPKEVAPKPSAPKPAYVPPPQPKVIVKEVVREAPPARPAAVRPRPKPVSRPVQEAPKAAPKDVQVIQFGR